MSLQIDGDIEFKLGYTSPSNLSLGTDVVYSTIYEYSYTRDDIKDLMSYESNNKEKTLLVKKILEFFDKNKKKNECTIRVEASA